MFKRFRRFSLFFLLVATLGLASCGGWGGSVATRPPVPPAQLMVELVPEGLHLSWTPVSGASHYTIFWGSEPGQYINCADASGHEVMITSPSRGELYACAVTAWNARGESQYSKEALCVYDTDEHAAPKYLSKAKDLMGQGELEQAQAYLSAAIRLQPEKVEAYKLRASVYEKMHAFDLAKLDQEVAVKLSRRKTASLEVSTR